MESPLSARRITRSQTRAAQANNTTRKMEDSENAKSNTKQRTVKQERAVLIDITNDSPIVGLAGGNLETPISSFSKQRTNRSKMMTPGSGEALLRSQVKNLLQRVEEEAEISKFSLQNDEFPIPKNLKAFFLNSPAGLIAPTPANTPQVLNFSDVDEFESLGSVSRSPIEDQLNISKVVSGIFGEKNKTENSSESEKDVISRTLFLDFSEKSDSSSDCSSVVTYQGIGSEIQGKLATVEDDDASIWSIQVNASTRDEDEDEDDVVVIDDGVDGDVYDEDYVIHRVEEDETELRLLDELCEGISNIDVNGGRFAGKHIKFVYNSDDELVEERDETVLRLKGLPTPVGKHLRFQDEEL